MEYARMQHRRTAPVHLAVCRLRAAHSPVAALALRRGQCQNIQLQGWPDAAVPARVQRQCCKRGLLVDTQGTIMSWHCKDLGFPRRPDSYNWALYTPVPMRTCMVTHACLVSGTSAGTVTSQAKAPGAPAHARAPVATQLALLHANCKAAVRP